MGKLGCIGFGAMGSALVKGFLRSGLSPLEIVVFDQSELARAKAKELGLILAESLDDLSDCEIVLLAIKPQSLQDISSKWTIKNKDLTIISILAGVTKDQLRDKLQHDKIIRVMPNLPAQIGKGVLAISFTTIFTSEEKELVLQLLSQSGTIFEIEEQNFDVVTALSGSGPAFISLMLEALAFGGVSEGLNYELALMLAAKTMLGTVEYLLEQKEHPAKFRDLVTSPAGTTAAGLLVLEEKATKATIANAVKAASKRSKELREGK